MRHPIVFASLLVLAVSIPVLADDKPEPLPPMTAEKWREDLDFLARELPKHHKNAFHTVTKERFAAEVAALREKAQGAGDDAMLVGLMRLTALVGDGHTNVHLPSSLHQLPLSVALVEGVHRVVRGADTATDLVGGRLVRIDDTPIEEAISRIRTILPQAESEVLLAAFTPQWFSIPEVLHGLGITRSATQVRMTVAQDDGRERSADLAALDPGGTPSWRTAAASPPLYRQRQSETFWFTWLEEAGTVYVNWRKYDDLKAQARELWAFVDAHPVKKIAVDLRQNGGGDFNVGRRNMVDELARRPQVRAYAITGPRTFSAALKNAIDFREVAHATLVGEPIGERPNSYSENDEMRLPRSRLQVSYSTRYYTFLPGKDGLVTPDKEIRPTWAEWVAGKDPVLEWILAQ